MAVAVRKEYARRSHEASEEWKLRMQRAEMTLEENDQTYRAVGAGMCSLHSIFLLNLKPIALAVSETFTGVLRFKM